MVLSLANANKHWGLISLCHVDNKGFGLSSNVFKCIPMLRVMVVAMNQSHFRHHETRLIMAQNGSSKAALLGLPYYITGYVL
jgi:hypothetical protein